MNSASHTAARLVSAFAFAVVVSAAQSARAAIIINTSSQQNGTNTLNHTYVPSSGDLLHGLSASASSGSFTSEGAGGLPVLTDGAFPSPITRPGDGPFQFGAFATGGNEDGTSVTYTLVTTSNITAIDVYGGWQDSGRNQQHYSIFFSTAAAPAVFNLLATVNFDDAAGSNPVVNHAAISDDAGFLATNVAALRFDFLTTENGYSGYAEIDVFGTPVPEPGTVALLALPALVVAGRMLRRRAGRR